jgi:hypothetical protein
MLLSSLTSFCCNSCSKSVQTLVFLLKRSVLQLLILYTALDPLYLCLLVFILLEFISNAKINNKTNITCWHCGQLRKQKWPDHKAGSVHQSYCTDRCQAYAKQNQETRRSTSSLHITPHPFSSVRAVYSLCTPEPEFLNF